MYIFFGLMLVIEHLKGLVTINDVKPKKVWKFKS